MQSGKLPQPQGLGDNHKRSNMSSESPKESKRVRAAKIFKETMAEIFLNWAENINLHTYSRSSANHKQYKHKEIHAQTPHIQTVEQRKNILKTTKEKFDTLLPGEDTLLPGEQRVRCF